MVYIILGHGFEEVEAIAPCDVLRRGGVEVKLAAVGNSLGVSSGRGVTVLADMFASDISPETDDVFVVPGGMGGVDSIKSDAKAMALLSDAAKKGALLAAICAGPSVLATLGLLDGRQITCHPGTENLMGGAICDVKKPVSTDGNFITARAAGSAIDFGLALLARLKGEKAAEKIRTDLVY